MNPSGIVHPYLPGEFAPFFTESVTVQRATENEGDYGEVVPEWADLPGCADIPANVEPVFAPSEVRGTPRAVVVGLYQIALLGYYPAIREKDRLIWGDRVLDITAAVRSPFGIGTLLTAREVR